MKKRLFSIITALALCLSLLPATALAASDSGSYVFDISEGKVTIIDGDTEGKIKVKYGSTQTTTEEFDPSQVITVTGETSNDHSLFVSTSTPVTIKASNLHIRHENIAYSMAMALEKNAEDANANVTLILEGTNEFYGGIQKPGIYVPENSTLTIKQVENGVGSVTANGGSGAAGIGGQAASVGRDCGKIIIESGTVMATGGYNAAGIGGGSGKGGSVTINGGTVTATGGNNGAGIGGGYNGAGGNVTINGGTVNATGSSGKGIGAGFNSSSQGTLSTGTNGSAVIFASSIGNKDGQSSWSGIIFEGDSGAVYGTQTPTGDLTIPAGKALTVPSGTSLTVPEGKTLNNYGTILIEDGGTLTNNGTIFNLDSGTVTGTISGSQPKIKAMYLDENGHEQTAACDAAITADNIGSISTLTAGWYVVTGDSVTISSRVAVTGDVHLILADGCTLTASKGIQVQDTNALTIYGQAASSGTLTARGSSYGAGIGGSAGSACGTVTINGGIVNATGISCSAGIGGGGANNVTANDGNGGAGGIITINGGTVTAIGGGTTIDRCSNGAGIGGGGVYGISGSGGDGGKITINGGTVNATGGENAAGIGGGASANGGTGGDGGEITISGGNVIATGGKYGAGIGGGSINGGSGNGGAGGTITISGGTVTATGSGSGGAGIGGGAGKGGGNGGNGGDKITISGGSVNATGGTYAAGIGGGGATGSGTGGSGVSAGGTITISGGTVTAAGGSGGDYGGTGGKGIGGAGSRSGGVGDNGTFSTGTNGSAVIFASSIGDQTGKDSSAWSGIIFEDSSGAIYGTSVTLEEDFEIPSGKTLTIASGQTLTIPAGKTLTVNGTLTISGTVTNNGTLTNNGTITGSGTLTPKLTQAAPDAPTVSKVKCDSITLQEVTGGVDSVLYSRDGETWWTSTTFSGLDQATQYTFYAYYKGNNFYEPSAASDGTTQYTAYATPGDKEGYSIDYDNEKITIETGYEVNESYYFDGKNVVSGSSVRPSSALYIRKMASGDIPASEAQTIPIRPRPTAPASSVCTINYSAETITFDSDYEVNTAANFAGTAVQSDITKVIPASPLYVRQKAVANTSFASSATTVYIPGRNGCTLVINNTTESVTIPDGYYYNTTGADYSGAWSVGDGSAVTVAPGSSIYIYRAATENEFKSSVQTLTAPARPATPNVSINYSAETLATTAEMQYSTDGGASWTDCTADMAATAFGSWDGSSAVEVQFRTAATGSSYASDAQTVTIPARAATPSPSAVAETVDGKSDGQITGLTAGTVYQVSSDNGTNWQDKPADTEGKITGLTPAAYKVRVKATGTSFASLAADVTIATGAAKTYTLNVTAPTFDAVTVGYNQPAAQAITISSSGNSDAAISGVALSGSGADTFTLNKTDGATIEAGQTDSSTYTVQPAASLGKGTYTATITVTYNGGATATAAVSFTVNAAAQTAPAAPELDSKTYNSVTLKTIADNANGAAAEYSKDGGTTWQDSTTFSGLSASTAYSFVARYKEYGNYAASIASSALDVTTSAAPSQPSSSGGSSGGGGSSSNTTTTTTKNPDGSTTTTVTDKTTGTVTETTKNTDGSTTVVETKKDGTVTETNKSADGTTGTVVTDKDGNVTEVKSSVSSTAAKQAAKTGEAVTLPVEVPAVKTTGDAPAVEVSVPKSADSVKVEIPVEQVTPGTVAVIVNADGSGKIVSTSVVTDNGVALTLDGNATVKVIDNSKNFIDVPKNNVFYGEISSMSAREIMIGKTEDTFDLHSSVTLDQIANVAGRIAGAVDVKDYNGGIAWGQANGLKTGNMAATRGDVLRALYVAAGSPTVTDTSILAKFNDASAIPADMKAVAAWAAQNGILLGGTDGNANLSADVTRGQACALAGRTLNTIG